MRSSLVLAALFALSACGTDTETAPVAAPAASDASNPAASEDTIPEGAMADDGVDYSQPVELVSMENGDRACYLTVRPDGEPERTDMADFGLCERTDLVGQRVALTVTPSQVMAESCQGNPECPDTEQVNLVTGIDPAEGEGATDTAETEEAAEPTEG
jgi:hypothetical protein